MNKSLVHMDVSNFNLREQVRVLQKRNTIFLKQLGSHCIFYHLLWSIVEQLRTLNNIGNWIDIILAYRTFSLPQSTETICPTLKKIVYINVIFAPNFGFCSLPLSSNNWIEHLQFCITVFLLTSTLHLLIINWFLCHDRESSYSQIGQIFKLYFLFIYMMFVSLFFRLSFIFYFIP